MTTADRGAGTRLSRWYPALGRMLLAAGSGVVLYLSFAPRPLWWLAPLAFTCFGLTLRNRRFWPGFGLGFIFGAGCFLPLLRWVQHFLGAEFGPWPWLGLSSALALYMAVAGGLLTVVARLPAAPVWMALVVIALEMPRKWFPLGGFPWGNIAFSQPEGAFLPLASIAGTPLVGFAVVLCGFGLADVLPRIRARRWRSMTTPALACVVPVLAGLCVWPTVGTDAQHGSRTIAAVQGSAPDTGLNMLTDNSGMRASHLAQSQRLIADVRAGRVPRPDLVVWPETATAMRGDDSRIDRLVADFGAPALIGATYVRDDGETENAVLAWTPRGGQDGRYTKQQLVPFGEYVPIRSIARWVTPFVDAVNERLPGSGDPAALNVSGTTVGVMICYEAAYDYPGRDAVNAGAKLLTAPTNNAWYGRSEMSPQHLAMSRLRAVEHSRAVVVSATTGISAIVRPDGSLSQSTELFTPASLVERVPLRQTTTLSDRLGPWPEYALVTAAFAGVVRGVVLRWRARHSGPTAAQQTVMR